MTFEIWIAYLAAVMVLMSTPGPSQILMMSNSVTNGWARAAATAAGDLTANLLQMLAAGLGLGALVVTSESAFGAVKWAGVCYLVWMGVQKIRGAGRPTAPGRAECCSVRRLWMQGFVTSAANPKAVVFFAALFPQFIDPASPFWPQFSVLAGTYLVLDGLFLGVYGRGAHWLAVRLAGPARKWLDRAAGGFLMLAAALLALKRATAR